MENDFMKSKKREATTKMRKAVPMLVLTLIVAVLIWVFGNLVFIPLAEGISLLERWPLTAIISLIILIALLLIVFRAMLALTRIADGISTYFAVEMGKIRPKDFDEKTLGRYQSFLRGIVYTIMIVLIFILIQDYLNYIHPALGGIVLLIIVITSIFLLYQGGVRVTGEVTKTLDHVSNKASRILSGEEHEEKTSDTSRQESDQKRGPSGTEGADTTDSSKK